MKHHFIIILLSVFLPCFYPIKAQEITLPFRNYNTNEGLANSDVYDIVRDNKGFLWLATDNGLSRFDGVHFKNFYTENGLISNSLTALGNRNDTLYIACYRKGVQRLTNNTFEKNLYLNFDRISFIRMAKDSVYMFRQSTNNSNFATVFVNTKSNRTSSILFSSNRSSKKDFFELKPNNLQLYRNDIFYRKLPAAFLRETLFGIDETPNGELLIGSVGKYFIVNKDNSFKTITSPEIASFRKIDIILKDNKNRIWIRDQYGKAVVEINHKLYSINQLLNIDEGIAIRNIFFDETNNNIWISTGGKGIFCFYNDFIENYSLSQIGVKNKIYALEIDSKNRLWIGTQDGFAYQNGSQIKPFRNPERWLVGQKISKSSNVLYLDYGYNEDGNIIDDTIFENQTIISSYSPLVKINDVIENRSFILNRNYFAFEHKNKLSNQSYWYYLNTNIRAINHKINYFNTDDTYNKEHSSNINVNALKIETLKGRTISVFFHRNDTTWVGSNKGLYWLIWSKDKRQVREVNLFAKSTILTSAIIEIKIDKNDNIYILSEKGLAIWQKNKLIFEGGEFNGKKIAGSTCIEFDKQNRVWLGTKQGLLFFSNKHVFLFNDKNGLNSSEINALKYDEPNNQIWIGTNNGLSKINITDLGKYHFTSPKLQILGVSTLLGQFFPANNKMIFPIEQNYLQFHLSASDYKSPETVEFEYALDGNNWAKTDSVLILPAISFGYHTIHFRVKNDNSQWSKTEKLSFEISPPFYQNWLFWLAMSVVFVGFIYLWFESNRRKQQSQLQLKRQIADLKQQGMASMMNPHFIFNALNSIQYYINTNDLVLVNEYLSKFGKLIRLNLESSFNNSVSLKNELIFIELYLSLEKLRFGDKFDYQIIVASNIITEQILLPPMFIQPFIENALIHGILPSDKRGRIELTINKKNTNTLEIVIEDNGIGFEASSKLKKAEHTSRSMDIIRQRILIMNEEDHENSISLKNNLQTEGTMVLINLKIKQQQ